MTATLPITPAKNGPQPPEPPLLPWMERGDYERFAQLRCLLTKIQSETEVALALLHPPLTDPVKVRLVLDQHFDTIAWAIEAYHSACDPLIYPYRSGRAQPCQGPAAVPESDEPHRADDLVAAVFDGGHAVQDECQCRGMPTKGGTEEEDEEAAMARAIEATFGPEEQILLKRSLALIDAGD